MNDAENDDDAVDLRRVTGNLLERPSESSANVRFDLPERHRSRGAEPLAPPDR